MKQTPCECIVWNGLPVIRKELARSMINDFSLNEKQASEYLCVTPSAVSQYISGKRGNTDIVDKVVLKEIKKSAKKIINNREDILVDEICKLCKFFTKKQIFSQICQTCIE
jgi:uncharacterized protein